MTISTIIVSYKTGPSLRESVKAVLASDRIDELVIVDNGNAPDSEDWMDGLRRHHDNIRILRGQGNIGFAKACNAGARTATGTHLLFLNPDAVLQPGTVAALNKALEQVCTGSVIGARLLNADGSEQRGSRRGRLTPWSALVSMTGLGRFANLHPAFTDMHQEGQPVPDAPIPVHATSGACMFLRKRDYDRLGGFDERYFLHVEDLDLCRRVRKTGGDVIFAPRAHVVHYGSTSKSNRLKVDWYKATGLVRYFCRFSHSPLEKLGAWIFAVPIVITVMARALVIVIKERWR